MRRRQRGFTLAELMVYMGLVTAGLAVLGGITASAQRSLTVQALLIDIEQQSATYLGALRRDVEAAKALEVKPERILIHRLDQTAVIYRAGERSVLDAKGQQRALQSFSLLKALRATATPRGVAVEAEFSHDMHWSTLKRVFRRTATQRRQVDNE